MIRQGGIVKVISGREMPATLLAALAVWASSQAQAGPTTPTDKASVLSLILEQRVSMTAIEATVEIRTDVPVGTFNDRVIKSLSWHPGATVSEARIWEAGQGDLPAPNLVRLEASATGEFLHYTISRNSAVILDLGDEEARRGPITGGSELLWCMRFLPQTDGAWQAGDISSLLLSPLTELRPTTESIDGQACVVLDRRTSGGQLVESIWLDPAAGWLPRLQRGYDPLGGVGLERRVQEFSQVDGRFLPARWTITASPSGDVVPAQYARTAALQTQGGESWGPLVGEAPHADVASVLELVAPGTNVLDARSNVEYVAGAASCTAGESDLIELARLEPSSLPPPVANIGHHP